MRVWKSTILLVVLFLTSCTLQREIPKTDATTLGEIFARLEIQRDQLSVHRTETVGAATVDSVEMAEIASCSRIVVHFVTSSQTPTFAADYMLKVTPEWLYDTRTMKRTPHAFNICTPDGIDAFLASHTRLLDGALHTNASLTELALSLGEPRFHTEGTALILRGSDPSVTNLPDNENAMVEIKYRDGRLLEIHFRHEHDFPATKQKSNYIGGTHYYFGDGLVKEFPPLVDFSP